MEKQGYEQTMMGLIQVHLKVDIEGLNIGGESVPNIELDKLSLDTGVKLSLDSLAEGGSAMVDFLIKFTETIQASLNKLDKPEEKISHPHPTDSTLKWR
jgi:hypothetical protein